MVSRGRAGVGVAVAVGVGLDVGEAVGVGVGVNVAVAVGVGVGEPDAACKSKTQSGSPALLFPGVVKLWLPLFGRVTASLQLSGKWRWSGRTILRSPDLPKFPIATVNVCATGV